MLQRCRASERLYKAGTSLLPSFNCAITHCRYAKTQSATASDSDDEPNSEKTISNPHNSVPQTIIAEAPTIEELLTRLRDEKPLVFHKPTSRLYRIGDSTQKFSSTVVNSSSSTSSEALSTSEAERSGKENETLIRAIEVSSLGEAIRASAPSSLINLRTLPWAQEEQLEARQFPGVYMRLFKIRLTGLVVITAAGGFAMAPGAVTLSSLALCTLGTGLMSCSANSMNQFLEVPYDSQMKRTQNRPLVRGQISPLHAVSMAGLTGISGFSLLYLGLNPLTASLGAANVLLYAGIYTPMKRYSIGCTWAGAVVGAIPPLMGWAACTGDLGPEPMVMAAILFAWQFPHFNGLSWNLRPEYSKAGYRVMCVTDPDLCRRTSLRYSVGLIGICSVAAPLSGLTTEWFALGSLPLNIWLSYLSYRFYSEPDSKTSRKLFRFSLIHLPLLMALMFATKPKKTNTVTQGKDTSAIDETKAEII